mgnify:CR=1 FL=1
MRKITVLTAGVILAFAVALSGCDAGREGQSEPPADKQVNEEPEPKEEAQSGGDAQTDKESSQQETDDKAGEKGAAEKKVELDPDLPEPMFVGTPTNFESDNLDPTTGEPRGEFMVPEGTKLVSVGKPVTSSDPDPVVGEIEQVTDGTKTGYEGDYIALDPGVQWVQLDLEKSHRIYAILLWHYHSQARVYHDVIVQVSNDPDFEKGVETIYNSDHDNSAGFGVGDDYEYVETYEGRLIDGKGVAGRYVRVYSNGNTANEMNHYTEVEVYGKPAE